MARSEVTGRRPTADNAKLADDRYLNSAEVKARYGGVSDMWVHRRLQDDSQFPPPDMVVGKRRFWRLSKLVRWERLRAASAAHA